MLGKKGREAGLWKGRGAATTPALHPPSHLLAGQRALWTEVTALTQHPARALGLDPRRDYAAAAVPRLLQGLTEGAHGLADAPLGLQGLAAPPGLEDLQVRPERSGMGQHPLR